MVLNAAFPQPYSGTFDMALIREFLIAVSNKAAIALHCTCRYGENSHHMAEALDADRVIVMNGGRVALDGTPKEAIARADELHEMGLASPDTVELLSLLKKDGVDVSLSALSVEECAEEIIKMIRK